MEWKLIERAPHDESIILWAPRLHETRNLVMIGKLTNQGWIMESSPGQMVPIGVPTHWMPLPQPPSV